jgi:hypothetical protein
LYQCVMSYSASLPIILCHPLNSRMIKPRKMRWAGHVARMGEKRNAYRVLVGKSERKRLL